MVVEGAGVDGGFVDEVAVELAGAALGYGLLAVVNL